MKRCSLLIIGILILIGLSSFAHAENNPTSSEMQFLGSIDLSKYFTHEDKIKIRENYAFVLGSVITESVQKVKGQSNREINRILIIVNVKNYTDPYVEGTISFNKGTNISDYAIYSSYIYLLLRENKETKLAIVDYSDPQKPKLLSSEVLPFSGTGKFAIDLNDMYLITNNSGMLDESSIYRFDITDPTSPYLMNWAFVDSGSNNVETRFYGPVYQAMFDQGLLYVLTANNILVFEFNNDQIILAAKTDVVFENDMRMAFADLSEGQDLKVLGFMFLTGNNNLYLEESLKSSDGTPMINNEFGITVYSIMRFNSDTINLDMLKSIKIPVAPFCISTDKNIINILGADPVKQSDALCVIDFRKVQEPKIVHTYFVDYLGYIIEVADHTGYAMKNGKLSIFSLPFNGTGFESLWDKERHSKP
jgi:hypothetical protein